MKNFFNYFQNKGIIIFYGLLFLLLILASISVVTDGTQISEKYHHIIDSSFIRTTDMREVRLGLEQLQSTVESSSEHQYDSQDLLKRDSLVENVNFHLDKFQYQDLGSSPAFRNFQRQWTEYVGILNQIHHTPGSNDPILKSSRDIFDSLHQSSNAITGFLLEQIQNEDLGLDRHIRISRQKVFLLIAVTVLFLIILGIMVYQVMRRIANQNKQLVEKDKILTESEQLYKSLFHKTRVYNSIVEPDTYRILEVNETLVSDFGYSKEEFSNMTAFDLMDKNCRDAVLVQAENPLNPAYRGYHCMNKRNGELIWTDVLTHEIIYKGKPALLTVAVDVTDKLESQRMLAESEASLRALLENTNTGYYLLDLNFRIVVFNQLSSDWTLEQTGKQIKPGTLFTDYIKPERVAILRMLYEKALQGEEQNFELLSYNRLRYFQVHIRRVIGSDEKVVGLCIATTDITDKKKADQKLLESEELYRSLFTKTPAAVFIADKSNLRYLEVNERAESLYGYTRDEFLKLSIFDLRLRNEKELLDEFIRKGLSHASKSHVKHRKKNGEILFMNVAIENISFRQKEAYLIIANDITELMKLENQLVQEKLNKQLAISRATIQGQEKERAQVGRELHDNVNQILTSAKLFAEAAMGNEMNRIQFMEKSRDLVNNSISEIRRISKSLVPPSLGELTLEEALFELVDGFKCSGTKMFLHTEGLDEIFLCNDLKIAIFRIVQEQLNNIMKHALAREVHIDLIQSDSELELIVSDDGKGFDTSVRRRGIGITNMSNRASMFNGSLEIHSAPGEGCRLRVCFHLLNEN